MRAAIDIGSNSTRLYIEGNSFDKQTVSTRLGKNSLNGFLSNEAMQLTAQTVADFVKDARHLGADDIYIFATEAVRSALNSTELISMILALTGLTVDVVSGELEGKLGYWGAEIDGYDCAILDVGGASVEIVTGQNSQIVYKKSLPIGTWRLKDICGDNIDAIEDYLNNMSLLYGQVPKFDKLIGIGGTATTLASMDMNLRVYDAKTVHLHTITMQSLARIIDTILAATHNQKLSDTLPSLGAINYQNLLDIFPSLEATRAPIILHGAISYYTIMQYLKCTEITISETDNLEGYIRYKKG